MGPSYWPLVRQSKRRPQNTRTGLAASPSARLRRSSQRVGDGRDSLGDVFRRVGRGDEIGLELRRRQRDPARQHRVEEAAEPRPVGARRAGPVVDRLGP